MAELDALREWLQERLDTLVPRHRVPGAAIAVAQGEAVAEAATGVLNTRTGVAATVDSLFQIGSITKVWTATLVLQLVDEGMLDLDAPVRAVLPEFRVAGEDASARITVRQLLCHTSGFEGDIFTDTGRGDDAVEKFLDELVEVPQLFPPGERFSYNNAGYCVLGRVVEVLRGAPYDAVLRERLIAPLGLDHAATSADEAILHRAAVGHISPDPAADPQPAPVWALMRSNAPAGSMLAMSARDLLGFARMHLRDGAGPDGTRMLSEKSARLMRKRQVELPYLGVMGNAWGLGWDIFDWPGRPVIGHDGNTLGQTAFLRLVPDAGVAVALLTNGGEAIPLYADLVGQVLDELAGVTVPPFPTPPERRLAFDPARYVGRYEASVVVVDVSADGDGRLWSQTTPRGALAEAGMPVERDELVRLGGETFVTASAEGGLHKPCAFLGDDGAGRAAFVHNGRALPRTR